MFLPTNMSEPQLRQKPCFVEFVWSLAGSVCSSTAAAKRRRLPPSVRCLRTRPPTSSPHHFCSATYADFYPGPSPNSTSTTLSSTGALLLLPPPLMQPGWADPRNTDSDDAFFCLVFFVRKRRRLADAAELWEQFCDFPLLCLTRDDVTCHVSVRVFVFRSSGK